MRKKVANILRILISISLLTFLILKNRSNFGLIIQTLKEINILFLAIAILLYIISLSLIPFRWGALLKAHRSQVSYGFMWQSAFIGFFYNNLLPTSIGGDFYRVYDLYRNKGIALNKNISAVVLERIIGTLSGFIFLAVSFSFGAYRYLTKNTIIGLAVTIFVICIFFLVFFMPALFKVDVLLTKFKIFSKIRPGLKSFHDMLLDYRNNLKLVFISLLYSFLIQFIFQICYYCVSISLGLDLKFYLFIFIVPFASLAASVPVSIGGIGIRENALVFILKAFEVAEGKAVLFSFIILFIILFNGLLGGLTYLIKNIFYRPKGIL